MNRSTALTAAALAALLGSAGAAEAPTAPPDADENVTVSCPASAYGTPVTVTNDVSSPSGDVRDVIHYTLEVPKKSPQNTGIWAFKANVKCLEGSGITFTAGGRTDGCKGNKQIIDMQVVPTTNKTGRVTVSSVKPSPQQPAVYTKYSVTFTCNIYRAN